MGIFITPPSVGVIQLAGYLLDDMLAEMEQEMQVIKKNIKATQER